MRRWRPHGKVWKREDRGFWVADYHDSDGVRHVVRAGDTRHQAVVKLGDVLKQITHDEAYGLQGIEDTSFETATMEYMRFSRANKRSWQRDESSLKHLREAFGTRPLSCISIKDVEQYQAERREEVKPASVNRELSCLRHIFNKCIEWNYCRDNPVRKVRFLKENNCVVRYLEAEERQRLIAYCSPQFRPLVVVLLNTGLRIGEALNLTWSDIDLSRKLLTVRNSKNGEARHVPLNHDAVEALSGFTRHIDCPRVFFNRDGRPYGTANIKHPSQAVQTAFKVALKRAGIAHFRLHDCRHDFASGLVMVGVSLYTVSSLLGHKSVKMAERYSHLSPDARQAAVDKLSEVRGAETQSPMRAVAV